MRILHFIYDHINNPWVGGGGAVRVYEIYRRLAERHDITVICGKYPEASDYREENINFNFVGTRRRNYILSTFLYTIKAIHFLNRHKKEADIIVEDFAPYNPLFSRFIVRKPSILQIHHKEGLNLIKRYFILGLPFLIMEKFYPGLFENIISVSETSRKRLRLSKAVVIPNGVDATLLHTSPLDGEYIAYVGRLHIHNKGLDTLIEAVKRIDVRLVIAGKGKDDRKLHSLLNKAGVEDKVEFKGFLTADEKKRCLANSKIFALPSRYEGQGIAILEAAACGKPVIVSNIPELKYAVDGGFGISFTCGDAKDLANKIKFLIKNEPIRKEMGKKAREFARGLTWDSIAMRYEGFLIKIVEER